jgi:hypothetical protein
VGDTTADPVEADSRHQVVPNAPPARRFSDLARSCVAPALLQQENVYRLFAFEEREHGVMADGPELLSHLLRPH